MTLKKINFRIEEEIIIESEEFLVDIPSGGSVSYDGCEDEEGEESDGLPEMEKDLKKIITECCVEGKMNCISELDYFGACLNRNVQVSQIKLKIAIFLGGFSYERHISVESGRNI